MVAGGPLLFLLQELESWELLKEEIVAIEDCFGPMHGIVGVNSLPLLWSIHGPCVHVGAAKKKMGK